ncbi:MAG: FAD-dependent oxidoreductase, partial [Bacillota bacterium]
VHGDLLIGPNSNYIDDKNDVSTTKPGLDEVMKGAQKLIPGLPDDGIITSFAGLRAAAESEDFIIGFARNISGFINVAGIQSPGLSSTPAIAEKVVELTREYVREENTNIEMKVDGGFQETLPEKPRYTDYVEAGKEEEWQQLVKEDSDYGQVICRCETITRGEIVDAIHSPVPARTIDAIKRRTRAGSGRCQGGFCGPRVVQIIADELNISPLEVTKSGGNSHILKARSKELVPVDNKEAGVES